MKCLFHVRLQPDLDRRDPCPRRSISVYSAAVNPELREITASPAASVSAAMVTQNEFGGRAVLIFLPSWRLMAARHLPVSRSYASMMYPL